MDLGHGHVNGPLPASTCFWYMRWRNWPRPRCENRLKVSRQIERAYPNNHAISVGPAVLASGIVLPVGLRLMKQKWIERRFQTGEIRDGTDEPDKIRREKSRVVGKSSRI